MPPVPPPAFGFASPWLLLGLGLAAVPIIIHLLFRRPHRDLPWAATRFLLAATKKHAKRLRLEQLVLLAVRVAALLLVALALAQPYLGSPRTAGGPDPPRQRILVIDASYSMGHVVDGESRFDRAKQMAQEVIAAATPGDGFHLVRMAGTGPRVLVGRTSYQFDQVAAIVDEMTLSYDRAAPLAALRDVKAMLEQAPDLPEKEVLLLSDFQRDDWRAAGSESNELRRLLDEISESATLQLFDASQPPETNTAIVDLSLSTPYLRTGDAVRFTATLRTTGPGETRRERAELLVDGRLVATETIELSPGGDTTVEFSHVFTVPGPHGVEIRLPHDAVAADDARFLAVTVRDRLRVLLVDGRPAGTPERRATFYLRQAIAPTGASSATSESAFEPVVIDEGELSGHDLAGYDAVVLANVGILVEQERDRLAAFAAAGGGVVFTLGDNVRPDAWNRMIASSDPMLDVRLVERVGNPVEPDTAFGFDAHDTTHAILKPFAGNPGTGLDTDFVLAYARATLTDASDAAVPLRFDTGDPAIVVADYAAGRVVLLTTSVDTTWAGPWPQTGRSFLPLIHEIVRYAATSRPAGRTARIGEPLEWTRPDRVAGMSATVTGPGDVSASVSATIVPAGMQVRFDESLVPGLYAMVLGPPIGRSETFAVNVDPGEGDLATLPEEERTALVPRGETLVPGRPASGPGIDLPDWTFSRWLLAAALGLLAVEQVLAWRFAWGLVALLGVAVGLLSRWLWLIDAWLGAVAILTGVLLVAGVIVRVRRRS